jgi:site-specific DNA-methyltransferase (adenine-specific)
MTNFNFYLGDCIEVMGTIKDKSIDFICCDLPFGTSANPKDIVIPFDNLWQHYERIIKDNGCIALFSQGVFYVDLVNSNRKLFRYDLMWNKVLTTGMLNANRMPLRQHEQIAIFYKKLPVYNPQFTEGNPLHSKGRKIYNADYTIKNQNYGKFKVSDDSRAGETKKYPTSILTFAKPHPSIAQHRTEKSIPLLEYLIKTYSNENETVLDNCMGSGTTAVACKNTNRKFIGIEIDEYYFNLSKKRILAHGNDWKAGM